MRSTPRHYASLIDSYLQRVITTDQFQELFMGLFKKQEQPFEEEAYSILDALFGDIDAYCPEPDRRAHLNTQRPGFYIDEDELRHRAFEALRRLRELSLLDSR